MTPQARNLQSSPSETESMKYADIAKKSVEELEKLETETAVELMKFQAQVATGAPGKDSGKVRALRRNIARIKTEIAKKAKGGSGKR